MMTEAELREAVRGLLESVRQLLEHARRLEIRSQMHEERLRALESPRREP